MECLVLHPAPPNRMEDYFYRPEKNAGERAPELRTFFDAMMAAAGGGAAQGRDDETLLGEFQRKGWYLAACCECPLEESGVTENDLVERFTDSVVKRVRFSYKPRRIALALRSVESLAKALQNSGFSDVFTLQNWSCD